MINIDEIQKQKLLKGSKIAAIVVLIYFITLIVTQVKGWSSNETGQVPSITVTGTGEVYATPDIAELRATISAESKDRSGSVSKQAEIKQKVLAVLKDFSVDEKDYKTEYISTNPKYEWQKSAVYCVTYPCPQPEGKQVVVGYTTDEMLVIKVRNIDNAGKIYEALVGAGVQNISGPNMMIDDEDALKAEARKQAIDDAKNQARQLARDLGVRKVKIISFNENTGGYPMVYAADSAMLKSAVAPETNISAGQNKITSTVTITYEIR